MTRASQAASCHRDPAYYTVRLRPGEGLWDARQRWEATGRRGLILVR